MNFLCQEFPFLSPEFKLNFRSAQSLHFLSMDYAIMEGLGSAGQKARRKKIIVMSSN